MTNFVIRGEYPAYSLTAAGKHIAHTTELRPLLHVLAHRMEPGDTALWERTLDLPCDPLASTESDQHPKSNQADALPPGCERFDGPEGKWRARAVAQAWVELGIEQPRLSWPTPTCGTHLCLNFEHLVWEAPKKLEYPEGVCVYCGMSADSQDHLLPVTWTGSAVRRHVLTVPACQECNSAISDRYCPSITERRAVAHLYIAKKNKKLLQMPDWQPEDIASMGRTLRSTIECGLFERNRTRERLAWPDDPIYDIRAMHLAGIDNPYEIGLLLQPHPEGLKQP